MTRGLFWSVLLIVFCWLTWSGWNEYQKVQIYEKWAADFDNSKYDIYAVLGLKDNQITWGKPTRKGIIDLATFSLSEIISMDIVINEEIIDLNNLPTKGKPAIRFQLTNRVVNIPFTEINLTVQWLNYLKRLL